METANTAFRVEKIHDRSLLCGGIIPYGMVKKGQLWAAADGSNHAVKVVAADNELVTYQWIEGGEITTHIKTNFAFQCRYCLVLDKAEVPEELK